MPNKAQTHKLHSDINDVIEDSQALLNDTASEFSEATQEARSRLADRLEQAKTKLSEMASDLKDKATESAEKTDRLIRAKPYQSLGIALGFGLLVGAVLNRR